MRVLSNEECHSWLTARGFDYIPDDGDRGAEGFVYPPPDSLGHEFHSPPGAGPQMMLARRLARWIGGTDVLLWITSWALYKPEEMTLFLEFRSRLGEDRRLIDAPGHLLDLTQADDVWLVAQLLLFMMAFTWEGFVLQGDRRVMIWMADEIIETSALDEPKAAEMQTVMEELFLKEVQREARPPA